MTFKNWIKEQGGPGPLSKKLGTTRRTIEYWRIGRTVPSFLIYKKIKRLSCGAITMDTILKNKRAKKNVSRT